jgi:hypothetical protein
MAVTVIKLLDVQNAIVTQLEEIKTSASAYNFDLNGPVKFGTPDVDQVISGRPEVFIQSLEEENFMRTGNTIRKRLTFVVIGITGGEIRFDNLGTDSVKLSADIEKALLTDTTLGGVVDVTVPLSTSIEYSSEASKGQVTLEMYCEYQVITGTP